MSYVRIFGGTAAVSCGLYAYYRFHDSSGKQNPLLSVTAAEKPAVEQPNVPLPSRSVHINYLKNTPEFDVLVIGGGATGCGVALDAVTRGLSTALVERDDFSSGTSSRSTKLIHGGVRYLQKAIMKLDREQYRLVKEALHERANLLAIAPHLSAPLPIMLPVYRWWQLPYFWAGIKMYDLVSGRQLLKSSYVVGKKKALELFPMLKKEKLCGAIIYYDGQHNDARMNLAIALTAVRHGASVANHMEVLSLLKKKEDGKEDEVVCGAHVRDVLTGEEFDIKAKCVVNATGPFTDGVRKMDDPMETNICQPSAGVHIVLPDYYSPTHMGLLDPATSDGRVIFFLPWEGKTIAGTTDSPTELSSNPAPKEAEIQFILSEIKHYLSADVDVRRGDVLAAWSGIRPLVIDPNSKSTASIARNHLILVSKSGLVTIAGGKWTTYRSMAIDTMDAAIKACGLKPARECQTDGLLLEGGEGYSPNDFIRLVQDFGLEVEVAKHLSHTYGNKAPEVAKLANITGSRWPVVGKRLVEQFPYIEAEIQYATKEYSCTIVDFLARRTRLAFLNAQAAADAIPKIADVMAKELKWSKAKKEAEIAQAQTFLGAMGLDVQDHVRRVEVNFKEDEITEYEKKFQQVNKSKKGCVSSLDLRNMLKEMGEEVSDEQLHEVIAEVDTNRNSCVELDEFLQVMSALKTGAIANNRFAVIIDRHHKHLTQDIPVDRSGGGL
ncbi:glycerol-3-phosphate dehydrogenase [Desmophyllum pertusum]|uniref:Glycerol-3-phosphate dehydrogenase n=1 Tax=Desmophyllum pertusum TaxID=174260 RepID=A0A9W9ZXN2_9CNID|nr:glycerol-3-phosphate dehydrogenase [Desmophyllum pertusum]